MDIEHGRMGSSSLDDRGTFLSEDSDRSHILEGVVCEDIIPQSSKVVVIDVNLSVSVAFEALVDNSIHR
jgi:hypothetical protein